VRALDPLLASLADHPLLGRLCVASLELALLSLALAVFLRLARLRSPRLQSFLWLVVLAKPIVSLAAGPPIVVWRIEAPHAELSSRAANPSGGDVAHDLDLSALQSDGLPQASSVLSPAATAEVAAPRASRLPIRSSAVLLGLWIAGLAGFGARYLAARLRLRRIVEGGLPAPEPVRRRLERLSAELELARAPALRATRALDSPALVGIARPVVLLPSWLVERGESATLDWALRHELAHCKWLDPLAILVRDAATVLFHFHPAVWWAARRHLDAIERACDRASLRNPADAGAYAESLYEILVQLRTRRSLASGPAALAMASRGRMARRIEALLEGSESRPSTRATACVAGLAGALVLALGCSVTRAEGPAKEADAPHHANHAGTGSSNLFFIGALGTQTFDRVFDDVAALSMSVWGRDHAEEIYQGVFDDAANPFGLRAGDLVVFLVTLAPGSQPPADRRDLLPMPWADLSARLQRGESVKREGSVHDLRTLLLAAPTQDALELLVGASHGSFKPADAQASAANEHTHAHAHDQSGHTHAGETHDHADVPDVFLMGVDVLGMDFWNLCCERTKNRTGSHTGRAHDEAIYDEIFAPTPNHYDRTDGDLMVLFFCGEHLEPMPAEYQDLLLHPWTEIESALQRGESVELAGQARGLEIVVLAAPTAKSLQDLFERTPALQRYRSGSAGPTIDLPPGSRYVVEFDAGTPRSVNVRLELPTAHGALELHMASGARHVGGYVHFVRDVHVRTSEGRSLQVQAEGSSYRVELDGQPAVLEYRVELQHDASSWPEGGPDEAPYATDSDVFWTGRALFLSAHNDGVDVQFHLPQGWRVSTPWEARSGEANAFHALDERDLVESFLLAGSHAQRRIQSGDAEVVLAVGQGVEGEGAGLSELAQSILDSARGLFGGTPPGRKLLVANLGGSQGSLNGGVFGNSISLLSDHPFEREGRSGWAPFVAHEIVHLWNGGAGLRSSEDSYWFSEGFTEYYAHVLCARLGFEERAKFLERVRGACEAYLSQAGSVPLCNAQTRELQYDGGFLAALTLDARLRQRHPDSHGLDDLMRELFARCAQSGRTYSLAEVASAAAELAGDDLDGFFARHVAGSEPLPLERDLALLGLQLEHTESDERLERDYAIHVVLHIRSLTQAHEGLIVRKSQEAGYQDGDRLLAIDAVAVNTFEDLERELARSRPGQAADLRLARGASEIVVPITLGGQDDPPFERSVDVRLEPGPSERLDAILGG
jgi:predicted metalloprotease with PDZ domain/beta-lactamase regulating signal transducer with metallopeptidase domain